MKFIFSLLFFAFSLGNAFAQQQPVYQGKHLFVKFKSQDVMSKRTTSQSEIEAITQRPLVPLWNKDLERAEKKNRPTISNKSFQSLDNIKRIYIVEIDPSLDILKIVRYISKLPGVEYAEPRLMRFTQEIPDDPLNSSLAGDYFSSQKFYDAWDISKSSPDVVIAVVDSGVDYTHDDLSNKIWTNPNEIADDGLDNDDNGFIDDTIGWDFWQSGSYFNPVTDNDPKGEFSDHGTHVSGIAAAETNNGIGYSGAGYNASIMAIKAGGTEDNPRSVGFGYEGILYAAANGVDVINCSWGGGGFSNTEFDIIQYAVDRNVIVVAATGNDNADAVIYPAAYTNTVAVASTTYSGVRSSFSNYGYTTDIVAVGSSVRNTTFENNYTTKSGTSMAAPFVSGLIALLKSEHPTWSPERFKTQIRASAKDIYYNNSSNLFNKLGGGLIDAKKALSNLYPGIIITKQSFLNSNGSKLGPAESGVLKVTVKNVGEPVTDLKISLSTLSDNVGVNTSNITNITLAEGETTELEFDISIGSSFDLTQSPTFKTAFTSSEYAYSDFQVLVYDRFVYDIINTERMLASFASDATIGFMNPLTGDGGIGFIPYTDEDAFDPVNNIVFAGSMMMAINGTVYDQTIAKEKISEDFTPISPMSVDITNSNIVGVGLLGLKNDFGSSLNTSLPDVYLKTTIHAVDTDQTNQSHYLVYTIYNNTMTTLNDVFIGIYTDPDIGDYSTNIINFMHDDLILYAAQTVGSADSVGLSYGIRSLSNITSAIAIDNAYPSGLNGARFGTYNSDTNTNFNGFTKAEKMVALTSGTQVLTQSPTDVSFAMASGPYTIPSNDSVQVGFIMGFGYNTTDLKNQINALYALDLYEVSDPGEWTSVENERIQPTKTQIAGNYPNPFNPTTTIQFDVAQNSSVTIDVFNMLGQKVATLADRYYTAGTHQLNWDASDMSSGVYFLRLSTGNILDVKKVMLLK